MPVTNTKFDQVVLDLIESAGRNLKALPINLGGVAGTGGGIGGPPGGFVGRLPQTRVTYDESEIGTDYTPVSGMSLVDNLNHIRHRINILESGTLTVKEWDGIPSIPNVTTIVFSGAVNVVNNGGGEVEVQITASGGGGGISDAPSDGTTYGRKDAAWALLNNEFLRLDASNDPLTGKLAVIPSTDDDGIYIEINSDSYPLDLEQFTVNTLIGSSTIWLYRETTGTGNIVAPMIEGYQGAYGTGTITGEFIHLEDDVTGKFFSVNNGGNVNIPTGSTYNINGTPHIHSGYMEKSYNLSDVANVATARTNLGLVAGGAGDIWVEKAGDTMTGQLFIDGGSDQVQLRVQGTAAQTANLMNIEDSAGNLLLQINKSGYLGLGVAPDGSSKMQIRTTNDGTLYRSLVASISAGTNTISECLYFYVSIDNNGLGVPAVSTQYGQRGEVWLRALSANSGARYMYGISARMYYQANSPYTATTIGGYGFYASAPYIGGAGTISIGFLAGFYGANQGTAKAANTYGLYLESQSGAATKSYGIYTNLGDSSFGDDVIIRTDNDKLWFGTGKNVSIYYDGTDMKINPKEVGSGVLDILGDLSLTAQNIVTDTTTGTKIGTAASQKLSLWNATPIVQPTTAHAEASFIENSGGTVVNVDSTFDGYTVQQVVKALRDLGVLA